MNLGLKDKVALVTGGSHGIGLATAALLAEEGCKVAICARTEPRLSEAAKGIGALAVQADVTIPADIDGVVEETVRAFGALHILVNNVGGGGTWGLPELERTDPGIWSHVYAKNAGAAMLFTRSAIPHMRTAKWGRVVTVASIHGIEGGGRPWFCMAKAAETALMKTLAMTKDLVRAGITFNSVAPGVIMIPDTGLAREARDDSFAFDQRKWALPMGRLGTPEEVARVIAFVCSEGASLLNGASIVVDGGESRRI